MKTAAAFVGLLALLSLFGGMAIMGDDPATATFCFIYALAFFALSSFCFYTAGRECERGRVLSAEDFENDALYGVVSSFELAFSNKSYRYLAIVRNFSTEEEKVYGLNVLLPSPVFRGWDMKNLSNLKVASEAEEVASRHS